jgi:hypothetical protein
MKNMLKPNEGSGKQFGRILCLISVLLIAVQVPPVFPADQMSTMPMGAVPGNQGTQGPGPSMSQQPVPGPGWGWGSQQPGMNPMMGGGMGPMMGSGMDGGCMGGMMGNAMGGGGMGGMMGNAPAGAMGGAGGMGMNMDQPMTMREILYILSMQDALQILRDVLSIQERILDSNRPQEKKALLRELKNAQDRLTKLSSDYREMIAGKNTQ